MQKRLQMGGGQVAARRPVSTARAAAPTTTAAPEATAPAAPGLDEEDLERLCDIADARLAVAEILGAPLGALAGLCAYLKWSQWPLAVGIAAAVYIVATMRFKLDAARAEGEYCREAGFDKRPPGAGRK